MDVDMDPGPMARTPPEKKRKKSDKTGKSGESSKGKSIQLPMDKLTNSDKDITDALGSDIGPANGVVEYLYDGDHSGPYIVYMDAFDEKGVRKFLSAVTVSKVLMKLGITNVLYLMMYLKSVLAGVRLPLEMLMPQMR